MVLQSGFMRCLLITLAVLATWRLPAVEEEPLPYPDMAIDVGRVLLDYYYDRSRIRPVVMVERALAALESAEVAIDTEWKGDTIILNHAGETVTMAAPRPTDLLEAMTLIEGVRGLLDRDGISASRRRNLAYAMLNGALTTLDPHTVIFPPEPADDFAEGIEGEFYGIGAYLTSDDGLIAIERVMPGLPAEQAGVEDGDVILGVDGEKTVGLSLPQTVRRIKGPKGTTVVLTVERKGHQQPIDISIVRDRVQVPTMVSYRKGDIGYIRMDEFNRVTARILFQQMLDLQREGELKGFVLDLRFNSGGLLKQARVISDFFLDHSKEIVRTVTLGEEDQIFLSSRRTLLDVPMVVLTGPGSASAAEILAGSLQLNDRAVVVGSTTFGKGSVQTIKQLPDNSQMKFTIQEYQLKGGVSIQERGVEPDVVLRRRAVREDGHVDLVPYSYRREADDEFALRDRGTYQHVTAYTIPWLHDYQDREDAADKHSINAVNFEPDQEATLVIDLFSAALAEENASARLAAAHTAGTERAELLQLFARPVTRLVERESAELAEALKAYDPDMRWGDAQPVPEGSLKMELSSDPVVKPGTTAELTFTVHNSADRDAGRLYALVEADDMSPFWEEEVAFGVAPADGSVSGVLRFPVPPRLRPGEEHFTLVLHQDRLDEPLARLPVVLTVEAEGRPHLSYSWQLLDQAGAPTALELDRDLTLRLTVHNDGTAASAPLIGYVFKDDDHFVQLGEGRFLMEALAVDGSAVCDVPVRVKSSVTAGTRTKKFDRKDVGFQLRFEERFADGIDMRYRASMFHTLRLPLGEVLQGGSITQPRLDLVAVRELENGEAEVSVEIHDDNLRFAACFLDEHKIGLAPADALTDNIFSTRVPLAAGLNDVRVVVSDFDEVTEVLSLRLWGEGEGADGDMVAEATPPVKEQRPIVEPEPETDDIP